jgi:hypothetical protein|tara:strand:+ start:229 stop:918 length:690 start_codon:yes stop_codon:yes gene_type:complete
MSLENNIPKITDFTSGISDSVQDMIPDIPEMSEFIPDGGGLIPDIGGCAADVVDGLIPDVGGIGNLLSSNPLCNQNLFKDIDGIAALGSLPSLPNIESVISASGALDIAKKLDPKVMFSGIPEFSGLISLPKIPEPSLEEVEKAAKKHANEILGSFNVDNPLATLCGFNIPAPPDLQSLTDGIDIGLGDIADQIGVDLPDLGGLMPKIPGLDCIVKSVETPDINIGDII